MAPQSLQEPYLPGALLVDSPAVDFDRSLLRRRRLDRAAPPARQQLSESRHAALAFGALGAQCNRLVGRDALRLNEIPRPHAAVLNGIEHRVARPDRDSLRGV